MAGPGPDPLAAGAPGDHLPAGGSGADCSPGGLTGGIPGRRGELGPSVRAWASASLIASPDVLAFMGGAGSPLGAAEPPPAAARCAGRYGEVAALSGSMMPSPESIARGRWRVGVCGSIQRALPIGSVWPPKPSGAPPGRGCSVAGAVGSVAFGRWAVVSSSSVGLRRGSLTSRSIDGSEPTASRPSSVPGMNTARSGWLIAALARSRTAGAVEPIGLVERGGSPSGGGPSSAAKRAEKPGSTRVRMSA